MVEGIPGSSPSWRGANMKTKGRCQPTDVPESRLGGTATGLAAWGTGSPDAQRETRRHYHQSQLTQTTAWDCLPCVDAHKQTATVNSTTSPPSTQDQEAASLSLALGNRQWRRHRREVPAPPCAEKPQGKRMLNTAPPSTCKELLQDPPEPPSTQKQNGECDALASAAAAVPAGIRRQVSKSQASVALCLGMEPAQAAAAAAASTGRSRSRAAGGGSTAACPPWGGEYSPQQVVASKQASKSRGCDTAGSSVAMCMGLNTTQPAAAASPNSSSTALGRVTTAAASGSSGCTAASDTGSSVRSTGVCQGDASSTAATSVGANSQDCGQQGSNSLLRTTGSSHRPSSQAGALSNTNSSTQPAAAKAAARGKASPAQANKKAGRVEDNPNFFRTPKDPPTLQRFADSLAQLSLGKGQGQASPAQRHAAGISARQQAQVAAAAREVAALDAGTQHDAD